ncbi:unnamed protein product [Mytilus edulis]|uniref:Uncharacterized protein n=1 Tax=Mytilus edulis TaxID=6550 RepID=A0A8S3SF85_MYTED|nr:unnamed protein product [Mytilus edulis]
MQDHLHTVIPHTSKLQSFLGVHQIEQQVHQCQRYVDDLENDDRAKEFNIKMEQNNKIENVIKHLGSLGELTVVTTDMDLIKETSVNREAQVESLAQSNINNMTMNIEEKIDINIDRMISDMICLMDGRLIIVAWWDKVILLTPDGQHQNELPISGDPFSVTQINQDNIAITYPLETAIKIFNMYNETVTKVITLDKGCCGLSLSDNSTLCVGLDEREIRIIDLEGNTLKSIQAESETFLEALVYCKARVIFSDMNGRAVNCVDESGKQLWQHTQYLSEPVGLCIDTYGSIVVADSESDRIIVISKDGKDSKVLLSDRLDNARSEVYNENDDDEHSLKWYRWGNFFTNYFKPPRGIGKFHHFRFTRVVFARETLDQPEKRLALLKESTNVPELLTTLPEVIQPAGLTEKRMRYLYNEVRPFFPV